MGLHGRYRLLLSSGRTGTTFLTDAIQLYCPGVKVLQEPVPSRTIHMMANAADHSLPTRRVAWLLHRLSQNIWHHSAGSDLIEVNPFVSPIAHLIKPTRNMNKVLMMVRHPDTWIDSMLNFKGYAWRARVTPYLPFVYAKPAAARDKWQRLSEEEKFAWRWVQINQNILQCAQNGFDLITIRYEDLFRTDGLDFDILDKILAFYNLEKKMSFSRERTTGFRQNTSRRNSNHAWYVRRPDLKPIVDAITEPMRREIGYE